MGMNVPENFVLSLLRLTLFNKGSHFLNSPRHSRFRNPTVLLYHAGEMTPAATPERLMDELDTAVLLACNG